MNVSWSPPRIENEEIEAAKKVLDSGWWTQGKVTQAFEQEICGAVGCKHAKVVNNGTSALVASLLAHGIGPGDEVIVPTYTFIATVNSVLAVGAKPVLVDSDISTFNTTPEQVEERITSSTKAIMPVDVAGMPVDIDGFQRLAKKEGVTFVQDAAESAGAIYKGRNVGSFDHTSVFSFHMAKLATTAEGGCVLTNDDAIADKVHMIRNHGMRGKYQYECFGLNFRTTDIQSAIGIGQIRRLKEHTALRTRLVKIYKDVLGDSVEYQHVPKDVTLHPYMLFGVLVDKTHRNEIIEGLNKRGIETRICWPPSHLQPYHRQLFKGERYPNAEELGLSMINLPMGNALTEEEVRFTAETLKKIIQDTA